MKVNNIGMEQSKIIDTTDTYQSVALNLMEDTMLEIELHTRYYNLVFIGLHSSKMLVSLSYLVTNVKE